MGKGIEPNPQLRLEQRMTRFRRRCIEQGLAMTHQRLVIYRALAASPHHPSPEEVYDEVKTEIPSISLATVYKNLKTFVESGVLREVSFPHQSLRLDANLDPHHHMVCTRCRAILDIGDEDLEPVRLKRKPAGFRVERFEVTFEGLCPACAKSETRPTSH